MSLHGCASGVIVVLLLTNASFAQNETDAEKQKTEAASALEKREFEKCIEITNRLLTQNPKDHGALYLRASAYVELGTMRHDIKSLRQGIEDSRTALSIGGTKEVNYYLPYLHGMTVLASLDRKKEHAQVVLDQAQHLLARPNLTPEERAHILAKRAGANIYLENIDAAIQDFQAAVKAYPADLNSHFGLAEGYARTGKADKALAAFTAAVEMFPSNPLVFNNRGMFYQQQGRYKEAMADFDKALQLNPKFGVAYANRGFTYQAERNLPASEKEYSQALQLEPNNAIFYSLRGGCRLMQLNPTGAAEDYNQAIRLDPRNPTPIAELGFAKYFSQDFAGAATLFDQAVTLNPEMRYLNPWRVWALVLQNKREAANPLLEESTKRVKPDWVDQLVMFLVGKTSEKDLVASIDKITEESSDPNYKNALLSEAYYFIGERRALANDKTNANSFYKEVEKLNMTDLSAYRGALFALRAAGK